MAGLLDLLLNSNTGTGSQPSATQNGLDTSTLQAAAPWGNGTNFNAGTPANLLFTQQSQQPTSFAQLLQTLMGVKEPQPPSPYGPEGFGSPGYQPSTPEQAARMQQIAATFPQSRNVVDLRSVPQFYPQSGLPLQQMQWGLQGALQANPSWPRPAQPQPPMMRYPNQ
jgi:hypothetical protein